MDNYLILSEVPFNHYNAADIIKWLEKNNQDSDIALAMYHVARRASALIPICDESNDPWVEYACEEWWTAEQAIEEMIFQRVSKCNSGLEMCQLSKKSGSNRLINQFMEKNGYTASSGSWVTK